MSSVEDHGHYKSRINRTAIRSWGKIVALFGVGMLPCPDCGVPMILHFWPLALVLLFNYRAKQRKLEAQGDDLQGNCTKCPPQDHHRS